MFVLIFHNDLLIKSNIVLLFILGMTSTSGKMRFGNYTILRVSGGLRLVLVAVVGEDRKTTATNFDVWNGSALKPGPFAAVLPPSAHRACNDG